VKFKLHALLLGLLIISGCGKNHTSLSGANSTSLIQGNLSEDIKGIDFLYYNQNTRISILEDLFKTIELDYALLEIKEDKLNLNFSKLKDDALKEEEKIGSIKLKNLNNLSELERENLNLEMAKSNLDFYDRVKKLIARFKDTHFETQNITNLTEIETGITFAKIGQKLYLKNLDKAYIAFLKSQNALSELNLNTGDEIVRIDGKPFMQIIESFKPYISGSSEDYIEFQAIDAITSRNFAYPKNNFLTVEFANGNIVKLPYLYLPQKNIKKDLLAFFNSKKFKQYTLIDKNKYDPEKNVWEPSELSTSLNFEGYYFSNEDKHIIELKTYLNQKNQDTLKTGYFVKDGKIYGVIQLFNFTYSKLFLNKVEFNPKEVFTSFIEKLNENHLDLILDLRYNSGGYIDNATNLISALLQKEKSLPAYTFANKINPAILELLSNKDISTFKADIKSKDKNFSTFRNSILQDALLNGQTYTAAFSINNYQTDKKLNGFEGKISALISPNCFSACDLASIALQSTKRAVLIGTHSNGTGAGFLTNEDIDRFWRDRYHVFKIDIPNMLFGYPGTGDGFVFNSEKENAITLNSENRPVVADVQYDTTEFDLKNDNLGWLNKAVEEIEKQKVTK
jgi:C-terminal processing protease CtpA/Prc